MWWQSSRPLALGGPSPKATNNVTRKEKNSLCPLACKSPAIDPVINPSLSPLYLGILFQLCSQNLLLCLLPVRIFLIRFACNSCSRISVSLAFTLIPVLLCKPAQIQEYRKEVNLRWTLTLKALKAFFPSPFALVCPGAVRPLQTPRLFSLPCVSRLPRSLLSVSLSEPDVRTSVLLPRWEALAPPRVIYYLV